MDHEFRLSSATSPKFHPPMNILCHLQYTLKDSVLYIFTVSSGILNISSSTSYHLQHTNYINKIFFIEQLLLNKGKSTMLKIV